jgi:hypothetical protein
MPQPNRLQYILAIIVAIAWFGVTFVPFISPLQQDPKMSVGVQAAMMLVLGAIFGKNIFRRDNDRDNDS